MKSQVLLGVLIVFFIGIGFLVYKDVSPKSSPTASSTESAVLPFGAPASSTGNNSSPSSAVAPVSKAVTTNEVTSGPQNCGSDESCLITAASSCTPASGVWSLSLNVFGLVETAQSHVTIVGKGAGGLCTFSDSISSATISAPASAVAEAKAEGSTDAEIQAQIQAMNASIQQSIGWTTTCKFTDASLATLLTNWKAGNGSSTDLNSTNCTAADAQGHPIALPDANGNISTDTSAANAEDVVSLYPQVNFTTNGVTLTANTISSAALNVTVADVSTGGSQTVNMSVGQSLTLFGHTFTFQDTAPYNGAYRADVAVQ